MKSKSIAGFVMGLVSGLILGFVSFYLIIIFGLVDSLASASGNTQNLFTILAWSSMLGSILSIVGASLCFTRARIGGIIMFVATVLLSVLPIYSFVTSGINIAVSLTMLWLIPVICVLVGAILAVTAKKKEPKVAVTQLSTPNNTKTNANHYCVYCGTQLKGKFCSSCGAKQD